MSLFSLGTLAAALAPGLELLVAARVIQASGTAIMMPLLMTTVMTLVPPAVARQDDGQHLDRDLGGAGDRPDDFGPHPELPRLALAVHPRAADRARRAGARLRRIENVTTPRYAPLDVLSVVLSALAFGGLVYGVSTTR